jgi:hypothetical protein
MKDYKNCTEKPNQFAGLIWISKLYLAILIAWCLVGWIDAEAVTLRDYFPVNPTRNCYVDDYGSPAACFTFGQDFKVSRLAKSWNKQKGRFWTYGQIRKEYPKNGVMKWVSTSSMAFNTLNNEVLEIGGYTPRWRAATSKYINHKRQNDGLMWSSKYWQGERVLNRVKVVTKERGEGSGVLYFASQVLDYQDTCTLAGGSHRTFKECITVAVWHGGKPHAKDINCEGLQNGHKWAHLYRKVKGNNSTLNLNVFAKNMDGSPAGIVQMETLYRENEPIHPHRGNVECQGKIFTNYETTKYLQ